MELKVQVPFQDLLTAVKSLSPAQKEKLKKQLDDSTAKVAGKGDDFIDFLLKGPVYSEQDIAIVAENRKSIAAWRTKI